MQTFKMAQTYAQYQLKRVQDRCTRSLKSGARNPDARISDAGIHGTRISNATRASLEHVDACISDARIHGARISEAARGSLARRARLWHGARVILGVRIF